MAPPWRAAALGSRVTEPAIDAFPLDKIVGLRQSYAA
jgi:hypothetical protein